MKEITIKFWWRHRTMGDSREQDPLLLVDLPR